MVVELAKAGLLFFGGMAVCTLIGLAMTILRADTSEYRINRERTGGIWNAISGNVDTRPEGYRDYRVRAGLAIDTRSNTWVEQGILSDETIEGVLTSRQKASKVE